MTKKSFITIITIIALIIPCLPANAIINISNEPYTISSKIEAGEFFTVNHVLNAISNSSTQNSILLNELILPASLGITFPKIDTTKIIAVNSPLLSTLPEKEVFFEELKKHGVKCTDMTLAEYYAIESTWTMDEEEIKLTKQLYPELENVDLTQWTIGKSQEYVTEQNIIDLKNRFTTVQLAQLNRRGINIEDTFYLFKEYHSASNILSKSNAELKNTIEGYYRSAVAMTMGSDAYNKINAIYKESDTTSSTRAVPPSDKYTQTTYPLYGTDYFHNDTATTSKWIKTRVYRTLKAQAYIYSYTYNVNNTLYCSNMWGTFSQSQLGAHEGIDFCYGSSSSTLYSPVYGTRAQGNREYHQVSIYDSTISDTYSPTNGKTYSFLHMTSANDTNSYSIGTRIGTQGQEGNATGVHLHFEVHVGNTTTLSEGNNHILGSSSPYQLTQYIGEAQLPT